jgi:hypothetical protein
MLSTWKRFETHFSLTHSLHIHTDSRTTIIAKEEKTGFRKLTVDSLKEQHRDIFIRAVSNMLSTEIAELTLAQIVDALPISEVVDDTYGNGASLSHIRPLYSAYLALPRCSGDYAKISCRLRP